MCVHVCIPRIRWEIVAREIATASETAISSPRRARARGCTQVENRDFSAEAAMLVTLGPVFSLSFFVLAVEGHHSTVNGLELTRSFT